HQDADLGLFLTRIEWDLSEFDLDAEGFARKFTQIARRFEMHWRLEFSEVRPRLAIFVSHYDHCLADLLYRRESGEMHCEIPLITSNHPDAQRLAEFHRVSFHHIPTGSVSKQEVELSNWSCYENTTSASWCWRATCKFSRHSSWSDTRSESSTSIIPFCPPSAEPGRIIAPSSGV